MAVAIDEYLSSPAFEHCEYVDGEAVGIHAGTGLHGHIQGELCGSLRVYLKERRIGFCYIELHCRLSVAGQVRYRLPDVSVILGPLVTGYPHSAPELCAEIRSPQDAVGDQIAKFEDYFANGSRLGWLVLREERVVLVLTPGATPRVLRAGDVLDGGVVLPGLKLPVAELFA